MKKNICIGLIMAGMLAGGCTTYKYRKAELQHDRMAYYKASKNYSDYLEKRDDAHAMFRLADCYHQMRDYSSAEQWYEKGYASTPYWYEAGIQVPEATAEDKLNYAKVLKANGRYIEAKIWFAIYLADVPGDESAKALMSSCDSAEAYNRYAALYSVNALPLDPTYSNFGITPYEDGYVYCTEREWEGNKVNPWNGRPYLNLVTTKFDESGKMQEPQMFSWSLTSPYHVGPVAFSPTYDRIYFSKSNTTEKEKRIKGANDVNHIMLYTAKRSGGEWVDIEQLPFNNENYSCAHPSLADDGKTMFFASDMPGGLGKTDLYMCTNENGTWSNPKDLGSNFNTSGYEMFPYFYRTANGIARLYFSSDGREGLGGLDIYYSEQQPDGSWGTPVNMGAPLNSSKDDFGIMFKNDGSGFLASSRLSSGDVDGLFTFDKVPQKYFAHGIVYNKKTMQVVGGALVQVSNKTNGQNQMLFTKDDGSFFVPLAASSDYKFSSSKDGYSPADTTATTVGLRLSATLEVRLYMDVIDTTPFVMSLPNIYYDFDKWNIRPDAARQLDKTVVIMKDNPRALLDISSHADSRGSQAYNMKLTEKRARSVVNYLVARGIEPQRLFAKWHGKLIPVNECMTGVVCSPAKHQQNRRSELKVINKDGKVMIVGTPQP